MITPSPSNNKLLYLQGALYTGIAALTPLGTALATDVPLTTRYGAVLIIASLIAGMTALKAFLSTNFADSANGNGKLPAVPPAPESPESPKS